MPKLSSKLNAFVSDIEKLTTLAQTMVSDSAKVMYLDELKSATILKLINLDYAEIMEVLPNLSILKNSFKNIRFIEEAPVIFSQIQAYDTNYRFKETFKELPAFKNFFVNHTINSAIKNEMITVLPNPYLVCAQFALEISRKNVEIREGQNQTTISANHSENYFQVPVNFTTDFCSPEFVKDLYELQELTKLWYNSDSFKKSATFENFLKKSKEMNAFQNFEAIVKIKKCYMYFTY